MSKIDDAIAKMTEECNKHEDLIPIEEYFTGICTTDEIAEKILDPKKSLQGAVRAMSEVARKSRRTCIPDAEGDGISREANQETKSCGQGSACSGCMPERLCVSKFI